MPLARRLPPTRTTTETTEIATDQPLTVSSPVSRSAIFSTNSPPESIVTPSIFATWLTPMSRARPPTKPTRIGLERKFARNPSLNTASPTNMTPHSSAWARHIVR